MASSLARASCACEAPALSPRAHAQPRSQRASGPRLASPWLGRTLVGSLTRPDVRRLKLAGAGRYFLQPARTGAHVVIVAQNPATETAQRASRDEDHRPEADEDAPQPAEAPDSSHRDEDTKEEDPGYEEAREKHRRAEHSGVSGSEDGTAPGNGVGRATLLAFSVRQNLFMFGGGKKGKGDGKDKASGGGKDGADGKGRKAEKNDAPPGDMEQWKVQGAAKGDGDKGKRGNQFEFKTLDQITEEKRQRNKEVIARAKAGMKARGDQRGMTQEFWSEEKQAHWEEYTRDRAEYLKKREAEKAQFPLESYADPDELLTGVMKDPTGPNPATYQSEEGGILSDEEVQRLQPITKPPPDEVFHKVGAPYKGFFGINPNSAGWSPNNPDSPDTGSHRGELNKYGKVATLFPYGTWIGERSETTFEAAPLNNNSPYWSLNYRPSQSQSVTITQHKASNHVKGGERITSSLNGLCNPKNKAAPRDGVLEIHKQRPRNRLGDDSVRSPGVNKPSYDGQSDEQMYGMREGTLPDTLNIIRKTRDAAEWMAKDSPAFTELTFARGLPSKAYKNAVVDKMVKEKMDGINPLYMRRLGNMTVGLDWSWEGGYKFNDEEYEAAKEVLAKAIEAGEEEGYIRKRQDEVDMLAKRVEQERRTLPAKVESMTPI